jgi:hypothetical protein
MAAKVIAKIPKMMVSFGNNGILLLISEMLMDFHFG